jgi:hypothetical protein
MAHMCARRATSGPQSKDLNAVCLPSELITTMRHCLLDPLEGHSPVPFLLTPRSFHSAYNLRVTTHLFCPGSWSLFREQREEWTLERAHILGQNLKRKRVWLNVPMVVSVQVWHSPTTTKRPYCGEKGKLLPCPPPPTMVYLCISLASPSQLPSHATFCQFVL